MKPGNQRRLCEYFEIDPHADSDSSWRFGLESSPGKQPAIMEHIGSESVCKLALIKKHYDALGNFLHMPSIKQARTENSINHVKIRQRCQEIANALDEVLSSTVFNFTLSVFSKFDCVKFEKSIRKRLPRGVDSLDFDCFNCEVSYTLIRLPIYQMDKFAWIRTNKRFHARILRAVNLDDSKRPITDSQTANK